jgi:hypothetical protein
MDYVLIVGLGVVLLGLIYGHFKHADLIEDIEYKIRSMENANARMARQVHVHHHGQVAPKVTPPVKGNGTGAMIPRGISP